MKTGTGGGPAYFFDVEGGISSSLLNSRKIALFLDFDGTLTPIRQDPALCVLPLETKEALQSLANSGRHHVTVLSGRMLDDVKSRVGIHNICYGGNHGLVISGEGMQFVHPEASKVKPVIHRAGTRLEKEIASFDGAWVERKNYSLTLHYRLVDKSTLPQLKKIFYAVAAEFSQNSSLAVMKGKEVLELTPDIAWNKGSAVLWILDRLEERYMPVFVGDDVTDETAFRALQGWGITVRVGRSKNTLASFYLKDYRETLKLLKAVQTSG